VSGGLRRRAREREQLLVSELSRRSSGGECLSQSRADAAASASIAPVRAVGRTRAKR
jgi:hypothetical protein